METTIELTEATRVVETCKAVLPIVHPEACNAAVAVPVVLTVEEAECLAAEVVVEIVAAEAVADIADNQFILLKLKPYF